ncbi:signal recognition particle subunit SRP19 [Geosmithia morbida]|uniref:Signal recognition particle subunit SRP19 n=1 Tax=Geosmithia morbida TaxID=1094350 RepID=A0A9P5D4S2_9HYPO|nr:signal recognition particle subunit SRP19 [Geosmithia morbida]KAF4126407.1 signal recognition particle subunit SRP19 [Geosmithia morbida]
MSHPRVEEVSDSDDAISDPEEVDLDDFDDGDILRQRAPPPPTTSRPSSIPPPSFPASAASGGHFPPTQNLSSDADRAQYASFQCLYPVYFDSSRSRAEGRRVSSELAVRNPLARDIASACSRLRLPALLEPDKMHPRDWANPGRVKVGLKKVAGAGSVNNKHHLYVLVARFLRENPTCDDSMGLRVRMGGQLLPELGKPYPRPSVPRGWKMGDLLPYASPAMTGGGVSDNLFKDMMGEMQGGMDPMAALMGAGAGAGGAGPSDAGGKKKKDKKKGKS